MQSQAKIDGATGANVQTQPVFSKEALALLGGASLRKNALEQVSQAMYFR